MKYRYFINKHGGINAEAGKILMEERPELSKEELFDLVCELLEKNYKSLRK